MKKYRYRLSAMKHEKHWYRPKKVGQALVVTRVRHVAWLETRICKPGRASQYTRRGRECTNYRGVPLLSLL